MIIITLRKNPDPSQDAAIALAAARNDWYVLLPAPYQRTEGPLSEGGAREVLGTHLLAGRRPLLLKVIEDWGE